MQDPLSVIFNAIRRKNVTNIVCRTDLSGSNARSCAEALRRLGHDVLDIDEETFIPQVRMFTSRVVRRLLWFRLVDEFNNHILNLADTFRPDIFITFTGNYIHRSTLQSLSNKGMPLYSYYPDTSAFSHGKWLQK